MSSTLSISGNQVPQNHIYISLTKKRHLYNANIPLFIDIVL